MNSEKCDFPGCTTKWPDDRTQVWMTWQELRDESYDGGVFVFCPVHKFIYQNQKRTVS
jgi:hypothetical protein